MIAFNCFCYVEGKNQIISVELPGVDPKEVKVTYSDSGTVYVNNFGIKTLSKNYYDFSAIKSELKHGLLTITVPEKKPVRVEVPLTVG